MSILEINHLEIGFRGEGSKPDNLVVKDISFGLERGEVLGIVGESGSGKSVTALSVLGLLPYPKAYHGAQSSIKLNGEELVGNPHLEKVRGNKVGFIFQEPMSSLNPLHRIEKQIAESLILHQGLSTKAARKEVLRLLLLTGIKNAKKRMRAYPYELSGGQRQRVMIAMAIANQPDILIADEPTTALDVTVQQQIIDLLLSLKQKIGMAIIFISHDLQVIKKIADKVAVMKDGEIVEYGNLNNVFQNPQHTYTKSLIASHNPLSLINKDTGGELLRIDNLEVTFPLKKNFWGRVTEEIRAVDKVSLKLKRGQTLGIVGESGSGKTSLGLAIVGLNRYSGKIFLDNMNIKQGDGSISKSNRLAVQMVFQDPYNALNPRMNIEEIVSEGLVVHFPKLNKEIRKQRVTKVLQEVGLSSEILEKYPHEFSGGQRQRIAIARALILEPKLLILDEPTSALDVTIQAQILQLLHDIQKRRELSYIFISHDMLAIQSMADVVIVMKDGKLIEMGKRDDIFYHPQNAYTQNLISAAL